MVLLLGSSPGAVAKSSNSPCTTRFDSRQGIAEGRFAKRRWTLEFFRDKQNRPCLVDSWRVYGSIFRFKVRNGQPRVGMLALASTSPPGMDRPTYVMDAYVTERASRVTFTLDGETDVIEIIRSPRWTGIRKDLLVHFIDGRRYDRDRTGLVEVFSRSGRLIRSKILNRSDFYPEGDQLD